MFRAPGPRPPLHGPLLAAALGLALAALATAPRAALAQPAGGPPDSLASFPPPRVRAWQVGLARPDRLEHMGLSFTLTVAALIATRRAPAAAGGVLALGLAKEGWDARAGSGFDPVDLTADASGIALALVLVPARGR